MCIPTNQNVVGSNPTACVINVLKAFNINRYGLWGFLILGCNRLKGCSRVAVSFQINKKPCIKTWLKVKNAI